MIDRRRLLIGGGAVAGLVVAWSLWPREAGVSLPLAEGETAFGGWIKIGLDGHVIVAVPQCEHGQGVYTALPQIAADELGADWRTVGVEAAPLAEYYGNPIAAEELFGSARSLSALFPEAAPVLTGASSSIRQFEAPLRQAAAAARALLCKAAVRRWGGDWAACNTAAGFVTLGQNRARFGELAADAASEALPDETPLRNDDEGRLVGTEASRLDGPAKIDGSANFAGDLRLPGMVFASVLHAPVGGRLVALDRNGADQSPGVLQFVETPGWVAAVGATWWSANRALIRAKARFEVPAPPLDNAAIDRALGAALDRKAHRMAAVGDVASVFRDARAVRAEYSVAPGLSAALEPVTATASFADGKLVIWAATHAPLVARSAAARAADLDASQVVLHPMMAGGSFGANLEVAAIEQAALLTRKLGRPVQLTWSRAESLKAAAMRPPARGRMTARVAANGAIQGWHAAIATPSLGQQLAHRLRGAGEPSGGDAVAVDGANPIYRLPAWAVDHHPAELSLPAGWSRGGAHVATCFFTECFLDELAHAASAEPLSFRIAMLGGEPRLARCLSMVAALGGWQGGVAGSGQGVACHAFRGSYIALMIEGGMGDGGKPRVERMVAVADVGRQVNPMLVRQAIEGGLIYGLAGATGASTSFKAGRATVERFRDLSLPRLSDAPDILVELVDSDAPPGGASELAVPVVGPALANAIAAGSGRRIRRLPL